MTVKTFAPGSPCTMPQPKGTRPKGPTETLRQFNTLTMDNINLSFAGCGFNGLYHVGVASCFREYCPKAIYNNISGCSAGSLVSCALACDLPLGDACSEILKVAILARSRALGPFHPTFDVNKIVYDGLVSSLPDDAHKRVNGRLHLSVTRVSDGKNVILSQFDTKMDLIQALQASCFIPFWSGIFPPKFHGVSYIDGGFSDNLLVLDDNTITVSPFAGESDICPQDTNCAYVNVNVLGNSFAFTPSNMYRLTRVLFPPDPETMSNMCKQGFEDALRFLQRNNKISCMRCIEIKSTFNVVEKDDEEGLDGLETEMMSPPEETPEQHEFDNCYECQKKREEAILSSLPDPVAHAFTIAIDQANTGIINWLFKHPPMKVISILTLPYVLPFDIAIVVLVKLWRQLPWLKAEINKSLNNLILFTKSNLMEMETKKHLYSAIFSCEMSVREYAYNQSQMPRSTEDLVSIEGIQEASSSSIQRKPSRKISSLQRSNTFGGRRKMGVMEAFKVTEAVDGLHRKSFAGSETGLNRTTQEDRAAMMNRRKSMVHGPVRTAPERRISTVNFGFTLDLLGSKSPRASNRSLNSSTKSLHFDGGCTEEMEGSSERPDVIETLKNLTEDVSHDQEISAISLAKRSIAIGREGGPSRKKSVHQKEMSSDESDGLENILNETKQKKALMAYYYMDENNQVKMTEIFNIPDHSEINSEQFNAWTS